MPFKTATGKLLYRIGDVIISTNSDNPSKTYGGSWQLLCPGKTLVCIDTSDSDFNTVKKIGGSKYLQSHNHTGTANGAGEHNHSGSMSASGNHNHNVYIRRFNDGGSYTEMGFSDDYTGSANNVLQWAGEHTHNLYLNKSETHTHAFTTSNTGNGNTQNLQPYMVVYMWIRVS